MLLPLRDLLILEKLTLLGEARNWQLVIQIGPQKLGQFFVELRMRAIEVLHI